MDNYFCSRVMTCAGVLWLSLGPTNHIYPCKLNKHNDRIKRWTEATHSR